MSCFAFIVEAFSVILSCDVNCDEYNYTEQLHMYMELADCTFLLQGDGRSDILFDTESHGSGVYLAELDDPEHANAANTALYELHTLKVSRDFARI